MSLRAKFDGYLVKTLTCSLFTNKQVQDVMLSLVFVSLSACEQPASPSFYPIFIKNSPTYSYTSL